MSERLSVPVDFYFAGIDRAKEWEREKPFISRACNISPDPTVVVSRIFGRRFVGLDIDRLTLTDSHTHTHSPLS